MEYTTGFSWVLNATAIEHVASGTYKGGVDIVVSGFWLISESFSYVTRLMQTEAVKSLACQSRKNEQRWAMHLFKQSLWMFRGAAKQSNKSRRILHASKCSLALWMLNVSNWR